MKFPRIKEWTVLFIPKSFWFTGKIFLIAVDIRTAKLLFAYRWNSDPLKWKRLRMKCISSLQLTQLNRLWKVICRNIWWMRGFSPWNFTEEALAIYEGKVCPTTFGLVQWSPNLNCDLATLSSFLRRAAIEIRGLVLVWNWLCKNEFCVCLQPKASQHASMSCVKDFFWPWGLVTCAATSEMSDLTLTWSVPRAFCLSFCKPHPSSTRHVQTFAVPSENPSNNVNRTRLQFWLLWLVVWRLYRLTALKGFAKTI